MIENIEIHEFSSVHQLIYKMTCHTRTVLVKCKKYFRYLLNKSLLVNLLLSLDIAYDI